jgi:hypothetical protein
MILLLSFCKTNPPCSVLDSTCNVIGYFIPNLIPRRATANPNISFAGASALSIQSATSVKLSWTAATIPNIEQSTIVYRVYSGSTTGTQNFTTPLATSTAGATEITLTGLTANQNAYFVVRARDSAGNEDRNTEERAALLNGLIRYIPLDASSLTTGEKIGNGAVTPNGSPLPLLNATDRKNVPNNAYTLATATPGWFTFLDSSPVSLPIGSSSRTYCLWVKFNQITPVTDQPVVFSYSSTMQSGLQVAFQSVNHFKPNTQALLGPSAVPVAGVIDNFTNWNFICKSYNSGSSIVYLQVNELTAIGILSMTPSTTNITSPFIGSYIGNTSALTVKGVISEVSVWNRALSPAEMSAVYKN